MSNLRHHLRCPEERLFGEQNRTNPMADPASLEGFGGEWSDGDLSRFEIEVQHSVSVTPFLTTIK